MEFSEYIETRTPADELTGTEIFVISQDGGSVRMTAVQFAAYIIAIIGNSSFRGGWDLSVNAPPSGTGSGSAGANMAGDEWYATTAGSIDIDGLGSQVLPPNTIIKAKFNGATNPQDFLWQP